MVKRTARDSSRKSVTNSVGHRNRSVEFASVVLLTLGSAVFIVFFALMYEGLNGFNPLCTSGAIFVALDRYPKMHSEFVPNPVYRAWRTIDNKQLRLAAYLTPDEMTGKVNGHTEREVVLPVSPELLAFSSDMLQGGRAFVGSDINQHRIMASRSFWNQHFAGHPFQQGNYIELDHEPWEIIGLFRNETIFPDIAEQPQLLQCVDTQRSPSGAIAKLHVLVKLDDDSGMVAARDRLASIQHNTISDLPPWFSRYSSAMSFSLVPVRDELNTDRRRLLLITNGIGFSILLLTISGAGGILLIQTITKRRDIYMRRFLGASAFQSRLPLMKQAAKIAICGLGGGGILAAFSLRSIVSLLPPSTIDVTDSLLSWRSVGVPLLIASVLCFFITCIPFFPIIGNGFTGLNQLGTMRITLGRNQRVLCGCVVIIAVSLTVILSAVTVDEVMSVRRIINTPRGFDQDNIYYARFSAETIHSSGLDPRNFRSLVIGNLTGMPGVQEVTSAGALPGRPSLNTMRINVPGTFYPENDPRLSVPVACVGANFDSLLGVSLVEGEHLSSGATFTEALLNQTAARQFFSTANAAVGKMVTVPGIPGQCCRVKGVLKDFENDGRGREVQPEIFLPEGSMDMREQVLLFRYIGSDPYGTMQSAMMRAGLEIPVEAVTSLKADGESQFAARRFIANLSGVFAAIALVLAGAQIYGLVYFFLSQYRRDVAIRLSFGASRNHVSFIFTRPLLVSTASGAFLGILVAHFFLTSQSALLPFDLHSTKILPLILGAGGTIIMVALSGVLASISFLGQDLFSELKEN